MTEIYYSLNIIPDLSLSKYNYLEENGVEGVLKQHISFLRQINRIGIISKLSMHLFYQYDLDLDVGYRLKCMLMFKGDEDILNFINSIINSSPLVEYFELTKEENSIILDKTYNYVNTATKKETFIKTNSSTKDEEYYLLNKWGMNEKARLYNLFKLMSSLKQNCMYRVDIYPVDYSENVSNNLTDVIKILKNRNNNLGSVSYERDDLSQKIIREYEDIIEKFQLNPHFIVNVRVFSNNFKLGDILLDSVLSQALEEGNYTSYCANNQFSYNSLIGDEHCISSDKTHFKFKMLPTLFTLNELAPFFVFPTLYDAETIEIPKETTPNLNFDEKQIVLGKDINGYDMCFPIDLLKKHAFISGVPGGGKTNTMLYLTSSLWINFKIPFLILEPAKKEYRALASMQGMEDLLIFSPGSSTRFPLHINPFEFPLGMSLSEHISRISEVFIGSFSLEPPMPFLLNNAIESIYKDKLWHTDTINDGSMKYPTIGDLYTQLEIELNKLNYNSEIRDNLKTALQVRIGSLLKREMGDVFNVAKSSCSPEQWLYVPVLIELENMEESTANFLSLMMLNIIRGYLKINPNEDKHKGLRHVIFLEEAHNLICSDSKKEKNEHADPKKAATSFLVKMLAEVRALRQGIVIADQLPTAMASEVLKNTSLKIAHRITSDEDRTLIGSTMSASGYQLEDIAIFKPGEALISYEGLLRPFKAKFCQWENSYDSPNDIELYEILKENDNYYFICQESFIINFNKIANIFQPSFECIEQLMATIYDYKDDDVEETNYIFETITNEYTTMIDIYIKSYIFRKSNLLFKDEYYKKVIKDLETSLLQLQCLFELYEGVQLTAYPSFSKKINQIKENSNTIIEGFK